MNVNVDEVTQIVYNDSQATGHNIAEVWQGGVTPTLLWPKDMRYYTISNVITYHIDGNGNSALNINAAGDGFAYFIGTVAVYTDAAKQHLDTTLNNQVLTPVGVPNTTFTKADGTSAPILYISQATHTINGESVTIPVVKGNNLENWQLSIESIYSVDIGYRTAPIVTSSVARGANTETTAEFEVADQLEIYMEHDRDFVSHNGATLSIPILLHYSIWKSHVWTSGWHDPSTFVSTGHDRNLNPLDPQLLDNPTSFSAVDDEDNDLTCSWNTQLEAVDVEFPANTNIDLSSNIYTLSASYTGGVDQYQQPKRVNDEVVLTQYAGDWSFGNVVIDSFYYASFDINGDLAHGTIIPAGGNLNYPMRPEACSFHQDYGISGSGIGTLRGIAEGTGQNSTVVLSDSVTGVHRTYTIAYTTGDLTLTLDSADGAVTADTKGTNPDSPAVIEQGYNVIGTVTLTVTDPDNAYDSEQADVYQEANEQRKYDEDDWHITDYTLSFNGSTDIYEYEIDPWGESVTVLCNKTETKTEYYTYTSGAHDDQSWNNYYNNVICTTFTVSGSSGWQKSGNIVTFSENSSWEDKSYTISDSTYASDGFEPSTDFIQPYIPIEYEDPVVNVFTYGDAVLPIIYGDYVEPEFSFSQRRKRYINGSYVQLDPIFGTDIDGGTASDGESTYTVNCDIDPSSIYVATRGIENGMPGEIVTVVTVTITVTCNDLESNSKSASIQQYKNYITSTVAEPRTYEITITHSYNDNLPPIDNGSGPSVSITGVLYYYNINYYASGVSDTDDTPDSSASIPPTSITCDPPSTLNPQYQVNSQNTVGTLSFDENQDEESVDYTISGTCSITVNGTQYSITSKDHYLTVLHGYHTMDYDHTSFNFSYPTDRDDTYDNHYHIPAGGTGDNPIVPSVSYSIPWRWNGRRSGSYHGYVTSGETLSFSGTVVASGATLDTDTGEITAESLGTTTTSALTLVIDDVAVSINGVYSSTIDIVQQINGVVSTSKTIDVSIDGDAVLDDGEKSVPALGGTMSFNATCTTVSTYTSGDDDSSDPAVDGINAYASFQQNSWCSFNNSHNTITALENLTTSSRSAVIHIAYSNESYSCTLVQDEAEYTFSTEGDPGLIAYNNTSVILNFTSLVNGHNFPPANNLSSISLSFVSPYNDGIGLSNPTIAEGGIETHTITYTCSNNVGSARYSTVQATQPTSGYTITWTVEQQAYPSPEVSVDSDYAITSFTLTSNNPWTITAVSLYDMVNGSTPGASASSYVSVSPDSGNAGTDISVSISNSLPISYAARLIVTATDTNVSPAQSASTYIVIMPDMYLYNYNNTYSWTKSSSAQSWQIIDTNYPVISWENVGLTISDWIKVDASDSSSLHINSNTGSERTRSGIIATGETNWGFQPWGVDYNPSADSSDITVTQEGVSDYISVSPSSYSHELGDPIPDTVVVVVTSSGNWTATVSDSNYLSISSASGSNNDSVTVTILNRNARDGSESILFECSNASTSFVVTFD